MAAILQPGPDMLTWGHLRDERGFCVHGSPVAWACLGRTLTTASRDVPGAPTRVFLIDAVEYARNKGKIANTAAPAFVPALADWLKSTVLSDPPFVFLYESEPTGNERRQQCMMDRDQLFSGTPEQRADVVAALAGMGPLRARLPHITRVLGPAVSAADIVGYLGQLSSSMGGAAHVSNVQQLLALEDKCAEHVHTLTAPSWRRLE